MIMDKKEKNFATYKEFAKMLREVANYTLNWVTNHC